MKRIAVICASPRSFNPGMFSVDLACHFLMKRHGVQAEIDYYILAHPSDTSFQFSFPFKYKLAQEFLDDIYCSDAIIYWGDFLHSEIYYEGFHRRLVKSGYAENREDAQKIIDECLFLSNAPEGVIDKCILFGGTQLSDRHNAIASKRYMKLSSRLIKGAKRVWMRDIYSALKVARMRNSTIDDTYGLDASFFLLHSDLISEGKLTSYVDKRKSVGVFFDRTDVPPHQPLMFSKDLCAALELEAEWLPWFQPIGRRYKGKLKKNFPSLKSVQTHPDIFTLLSSLEQYDLIITDTYHLCLNAWSSGTPAICITNGNEMGPGALMDKKKEVFFFTNEAQDFLVDTERLNLFSRNYVSNFFNYKKQTAKKDLINHLKEVVLNDELSKSIRKNLRDHSASVEESFIDELKGLIS